MKTAGIIMECNPLHPGHIHILRKAAEEGAEGIIAVMSGDFVQRGLPAVFSKEARAEALLRAGADLVLEIPARYAVESSGYFSSAAVDILCALGSVTDLYFGSESGDLESLRSMASSSGREEDTFRDVFRSEIRSGSSYPLANARALSASGSAALPSAPNDMLGVHYLKELSARGSSIVPHAVSRIETPSASSIRAALKNCAASESSTVSKDSTSLKKGSCTESAASLLVPELQQCRSGLYPLIEDDFSAPLLLALLRARAEGPDSLTRFSDVNTDLANRILNRLGEFRSFSQYTLLLKSRNYTYTRISRTLLHILLELKADDLRLSEKAGRIGYARVLGFRKNSRLLLRDICVSSAVPLIFRPSEIPELPPVFRAMYEEDLKSSHLYDSFRALRYPESELLKDERQKKLIVL